MTRENKDHMNYIFLDTCVLLDVSTKRSDLPLVSALEELVSREFEQRKISLG